MLWEEVCKDDKLTKNHVRTLERIKAFKFRLEWGSEWIGKDGDANVRQEPESSNGEVDIDPKIIVDIEAEIEDEIEHEPKCEIEAKHKKPSRNNDDVVDIQAKFNYEDFSGFEGINDFGNDFWKYFDNDLGSEDDTYRGDRLSSSNTEEIVIDDDEF